MRPGDLCLCPPSTPDSTRAGPVSGGTANVWPGAENQPPVSAHPCRSECPLQGDAGLITTVPSLRGRAGPKRRSLSARSSPRLRQWPPAWQANVRSLTGSLSLVLAAAGQGDVGRGAQGWPCASAQRARIWAMCSSRTGLPIITRWNQVSIWARDQSTVRARANSRRASACRPRWR